MTITDSQQAASSRATTSHVPLSAGPNSGEGLADPGSSTRPPPPTLSPAFFDPTPFLDLRIWAQCFEDAQKARLAIENRLRSGEVDATVTSVFLANMLAAEKEIDRLMQATFRRVAPSFAAWAKANVGIGGTGDQRLIARFLGATGHPAVATPHHWEQGGEGDDKRVLVDDPPYVRSLPQWLSYCGHGDANRKRRKGMSQVEALAMGNPRAKMLVHLLAESVCKCVGSPATVGANSIPRPQGTDRPGETRVPPNTQTGHASPGQPSDDGPGSNDVTTPHEPRAKGRRRSLYRDIYDVRKIETVDRDWTPAHAHADALRIVGKAILADLYELGMKDLASRGGAMTVAPPMTATLHPGSPS